jgi:hypothetical protein
MRRLGSRISLMTTTIGNGVRRSAPNVLQVAALACVVAGFWLLSLPVGLMALGLALGLIGWAVD